MLFDEAHTDDLKSWLTSELGPICDADPEVLADYVLALLKHEGPEAELQTLLTEQLEDFLAAETEPFVTKTFQAIAYKSYLPSSESHSATADPSNDTHALASTSDTAADTSTSSRKRRADHDDDNANDSTRSPPRQTRRLQEDSSATQGMDDSRAGRARERDSRERPDTNGSQNERRDARPKQLCRDYHNKGFCPRGASCKFEHSADVQPGNPNARNHPQQQQQQQQQPPFHMMGPGGPNGMHGPPMMFPGAPFGMPPQGWHPSMGPPPGMGPNNAGPGASPSHNGGDAQALASRMGGQLPPQAADAMPFANQPGPFNGGGMGPGVRGGAMGGRGRGRGGGPPGTFQSSRRSNTTLVIENVPAEHLDLIKVNEYFKKFGTITNISIDKPGSKALVSYSQPSEAKTAHESPDVIFGNRFVKVYFQRLDEAAGGPSAAVGASPTPRPPPSAAAAAGMPPRNNFVPGKTSNVYHARPPVAGGSAPAAGGAGGMSEERKKLLEDQRTKQAALDAQLAEQKSLLAKFGVKDLSAEDKKQTMTQLKKLGDEIKASTEAVKAAVEALQAAPKDAPAAAGAGAEGGSWKEQKEKREKEQLDRELDMHAQGSSPSSTTEELKKKLESLKAEAASLGIDGIGAAGSYGFNSRGRGRGGYIPRGRGGYAPYAARGGALGGNRSFRIDNRTTKLKIEDLPQGVDAEKVKTHFAGFGELESFDAESATVVYKARTSAEQALRGGAEIPEVGSVKLSWIQPAPAAATVTAATTTGPDESSAATGNEGGGEEEYDDDRDSSWKR